MATPEIFKTRGSDSTRIEAFVDAAFAFATTLLVISFDEIPGSYAELVEAMKGIPPFLASFAIIAMFWVGHRNWSNRFGLDTTFSTLVSLALVCVILVYVYPLRSMMATVFSIITNGWIPEGFRLETAAQARGLFTIYGVAYIVAGSCMLALNQHALNWRETLALSDAEVYATTGELLTWYILVATGVASIALAWTLPGNLIGLAGWIYATQAISIPGAHAWRDRRSKT